MRVVVAGLGAIGSLVAARLARAGIAPLLVARDDAGRRRLQQGWSVTDRDGTWHVGPDAFDIAGPGTRADTLLVATKAQLLPEVSGALKHLLHEHTTVVTLVNGLPWWYLHGLTLDWTPSLESVDPGGRIAADLGAHRALGCVVHLGASIPQPGVTRHTFGNRLVIGEPAGGISARLGEVAAVLGEAGFRVETTDAIRDEVWRKLWSNVAINPVSVLAEADCSAIAADAGLSDVLVQMMQESERVARRLGATAELDCAERLRGIAAIGAFRTSMLQDYEAGRSLELGPLLGAVIELARGAQVETPVLDTVHAAVRFKVARGQSLAAKERTP